MTRRRKHSTVFGVLEPGSEIGFCIYCGSTDQLSREHILPRGLGGKFAITGTHSAAVLNKASCELCRIITKNIESYCQREMFGHLRRRLKLIEGMPPAFVRGILFMRDGSTKDIVDRPERIPVGMFLPVFDRNPRLFLPTGVSHNPIREWIGKIVFPTINPAPLRGDESEIGHVIMFDAEIYQRMLAKIALGFATMYFGVNHFRPLVTDFIRGLEKDATGKYIFGFDLEDEKPSTPEMMIRHRIVTNEESFDGTTYAVCRIRLFANYGTPTNCVIVGVVE